MVHVKAVCESATKTKQKRWTRHIYCSRATANLLEGDYLLADALKYSLYSPIHFHAGWRLWKIEFSNIQKATQSGISASEEAPRIGLRPEFYSAASIFCPEGCNLPQAFLNLKTTTTTGCNLAKLATLSQL